LNGAGKKLTEYGVEFPPQTAADMHPVTTRPLPQGALVTALHPRVSGYTHGCGSRLPDVSHCYIGQNMTTLGKASVVLLGTSWGNTSRTWGPCEDLKITDWEQKKKKIQYPHPPKRQNLEKFECMLYCLIAWAKFLFLHLFVNMFKQ
jgi:hypothetical protein